jgi:uncharacterized SAM-binding protein YcdF (DUF218 family)
MSHIPGLIIVFISLFWLMFLTGLGLYFFKHKKTGLVLTFLSFLWLVLISLNFLPGILIKTLESRYQPLTETSQISNAGTIYILVLGGGHSEDANLSPAEQLMPSSLGRLKEGIRLHNLLPGSQLVFSGRTLGQKYSHAEILRIAALSLGVEDSIIKILPVSENTREEASDFTDRFGTKNTLILVTDAIHMPRAMLLFRKAGQEPVPAPTNFSVNTGEKGFMSDWNWSGLNRSKMGNAMHEIVGLIWAEVGVRKRDER